MSDPVRRSKHHTPDEVADRITIVSHELNMLLRLAPEVNIKVNVDTIEHDGWTELIVTWGKR